MSFKTQIVLAALVACVALPAPIARAAPTPFNRRAAFTLQNGKDAQNLNAKFAKLTANDACKDGESGCVDGGFAQCVSGKWDVTPCSNGLQCFALPLVNSAGTSITCDTKADAQARIAASGATGGIDGSGSSSSSSNTSAIQSGSAPSSTATTTSTAPTTTGSPDDDTDTGDDDSDEDCSSMDESTASSTSAPSTTSSASGKPTAPSSAPTTTKAAASSAKRPTGTSPPISVIETIPAKRAFGDAATTVTHTVVSTQYVTVSPAATTGTATRLAPSNTVTSSTADSVAEATSSSGVLPTAPAIAVINTIPNDNGNLEADTSSVSSFTSTRSAANTLSVSTAVPSASVSVISVRPSATLVSTSRSTSIAVVTPTSVRTSSIAASTSSSSTTGRFHFSGATRPTATPTPAPGNDISDADLASLLTATVSI